MAEISEDPQQIVDRAIEDEMRSAFIDYSMSVIVSRALPDVRDGLKPVHRRILYAMQHNLGLYPNRGYRKSASVVGEVLGHYHPHGDAAVYDAMVRMVQNFSLRVPLVDGQGNYGSIDGDPAAAYRYTEARLAPAAMDLLADIDKETVEFTPNFDDRSVEPTVLPARLPNLLVNGATGIAVGMATNIPPHNVRDVVNACIHLIDHPDCAIDDLIGVIKAPDFPTGGMICGMDGVREAYLTGRGRVVLRARADIEINDSGRDRIIVRDVPYMVNKERLVKQIADLVHEKKITDIADLRDETAGDGVRIVIELKKDAIPHIVLNQLYRHSQLQTTFGVIMIALVNGRPEVLNLKQILQHFVEFRHEVVLRRTQFDHRKAKDREHILEGLKVAVDNIDEVIHIIRSSSTSEEAGQRMRERFAISERQTDAILNMRLAKLTGLEIEQLEAELTEVRAVIADLEDILARRERRGEIIRNELVEVAARHGDERRTDILAVEGDLSIEDLIPDEENVITVSHAGYIKRLPADTYRRQRRGGRGVTGMETKDDDWVEHLFLANTHDTLLFFTKTGLSYRLKVHEIPQGSRQSRGKPIINLLDLDASQGIAALLPVREFTEGDNLVFVTRQGTFKKTELSAYANIRANGLIAMTVDEGDELIDVRRTSGSDEVILATRSGMSVRFNESDIRTTGRATKGVRGIRLDEDDAVVGMVIPRESPMILTVTENGIGKRTPVEDYRIQWRGGRGVINLRVTDKTGPVVSVRGVSSGDEVIITTRSGVINRQSTDAIPAFGRNTQGVRLIALDAGDRVIDAALTREDDDAEVAGADDPANDLPGDCHLEEGVPTGSIDSAFV